MWYKRSDGHYVTTASNMYTATALSSIISDDGGLLHRQTEGFNVSGNCVRIPVFVHHGTIYLPSAMVKYDDFMENGKYYKIDNDTYFASEYPDTLIRVT